MVTRHGGTAEEHLKCRSKSSVSGYAVLHGYLVRRGRRRLQLVLPGAMRGSW